ncbi:MAG: hypothetical protein M3R59_11540 [Verrucomicrobiota bacterium]|nr:hypothetical protein [Verrucomicrobiota bacterium]
MKPCLFLLLPAFALLFFTGCAQTSADVPAEGPDATVAATAPVSAAWVPQK